MCLPNYAGQSTSTVLKPLTPHQKTARRKEIQSLLKLLAGMILVAYEDDAFLKGNLVSEISSDPQLKGISLDEDTIRKWVNEVKEFVDTSARTKAPKPKRV